VREEPTEIVNGKRKGSIWKTGGKETQMRTYKGGAIIHTNPECPCYMLDSMSGILKSGDLLPGHKRGDGTGNSWKGGGGVIKGRYGGDKGGASRFFYCAKASKKERNMGLEGMEQKKAGNLEFRNRESGKEQFEGRQQYAVNNHPTVKSLRLLEYLCTLTKTPTGGIVLDPFAGSGTTGMACKKTGRDYILIEKDSSYCDIARARIKAIQKPLL
jgi:site-specific DNA-methyltransferase (adenine-specific)